MKKILFILCMTALVAGCKNDDPESADALQQRFISQSVPGAYANGNATFKFDENLHQTAVNSAERTYRIQTDAQDTYVHYTLSAPISSVGQELTLGVSTKGVPGIYSKVYNVKVLDIKNGNVWLWSNDDKTGFIAPQF